MPFAVGCIIGILIDLYAFGIVVPSATTKSAAELTKVCATHKQTSSISFQENGRAIVVCKDGTVKWAPR